MLRTPRAELVLEGFGDNALLFNLRVSLPDIDKAAGVQSDLRIAILKALRRCRHRHPVRSGRRQPARPWRRCRRYLDEVLERPIKQARGQKSASGIGKPKPAAAGER